MTWEGTRSPVYPPTPAWLRSVDPAATVIAAPRAAAELEPKRALFRWVLWHWSRRPELRALALEISRGARTDRERLERVARWVASEIDYVQESGEVIELPGWTLKHRAADCDGHSLLVGSLLGAVGFDCVPVFVWRGGHAIHVLIGAKQPPTVPPMLVDTTNGGEAFYVQIDSVP